MKKIVFVAMLLCGGELVAAGAKRMGNKEFVVRKQRYDSFQKIEKPRYFAQNPLSRAEIQDQHTFQDLDYDIKDLSFELQLGWDKRRKRRLRHNLLRWGLGCGFNSKETLLAGVVDVLFHKKIKDFSTHVIFSFKTPDYPGLDENVEIYADYQVTDYFRPYIIFGQAYKSFKKKPAKDAKIRIFGASDLNFRFVAGLPFAFEKIKFHPSLSWQKSYVGFSMVRNHSADIPDCIENDITVNFDAEAQVLDNQEFLIEFSLKNLFYNKGCPITRDTGPDFVLQPLKDQNSVHFLHIQPKYLLTINDFYLGPKLTIDYCSNKKFVRDNRFSFLPGFEGGWYINDIFDVYLNFENGMKTYTAGKILKINPWVTPQAILSRIDKAGFSIGGNAKFSNFKFNVCFGLNYFDIFYGLTPVKGNPDKIDQEQEKYDYPLPYASDVVRLKENLGGSFENDYVTVLLNGTFYQVPLGPCYMKLKSDVFVKIIDKILLHFNVRHIGLNGSSYWNLGFGGDYLFSDVFGCFFTVENILKNELKTFKGMPAGIVKLMAGVSVVPDRWFEKNSEEIVE